MQLLNRKNVFASLPMDDVDMHIINFIRICTLYNLPGVSDKALKIRLFLFSLIGKATLCIGKLHRVFVTS